MSTYDAHEQLVEQIMLSVGALPTVRVWRQVTGNFLTMKRKNVVSVGIKGQADLTGILFCGKRLEVEVKTGSGRRTSDQRTWGRVMEEWGAFYVEARSVEDVQEALKEHARRCEECRRRALKGTTNGSSGPQGNDRRRQ